MCIELISNPFNEFEDMIKNIWDTTWLFCIKYFLNIWIHEPCAYILWLHVHNHGWGLFQFIYYF